jgi:hypothetical protein
MTTAQLIEASIRMYVASAYRACVAEGRDYSPILLPKDAA